MKTSTITYKTIFLAGLMLFLSIILAFSSFEEFTYTGFLKLKIPIQMTIRFENDTDNTFKVSGFYFNARKGENNNNNILEGKYNPSTKKIKLIDKNTNGKIIGHFDGELNESKTVFFGWYASTQNDKSYVFQLKIKR